jgi:glycosyltransferase involved in cell wall biosynthesis
MLVMPYRDGASLRRGTLMAALAHGRPLITTTPASPTPELVDGQNVRLIPRGDAAALAEAVRRLASDGALRDALGAGASELAGRFTWDRIAAQTLDFYTEILSPSVAEANGGRR